MNADITFSMEDGTYWKEASVEGSFDCPNCKIRMIITGPMAIGFCPKCWKYFVPYKKCRSCGNEKRANEWCSKCQFTNGV